MACAHANVTLTLAPILDDGWCKARTLDNQLFFFLVEDEAGGSVLLRVRPPESKWAGMLWTCQVEPWEVQRVGPQNPGVREEKVTGNQARVEAE